MALARAVAAAAGAECVLYNVLQGDTIEAAVGWLLPPSDVTPAPGTVTRAPSRHTFPPLLDARTIALRAVMSDAYSRTGRDRG